MTSRKFILAMTILALAAMRARGGGPPYTPLAGPTTGYPNDPPDLYTITLPIGGSGSNTGVEVDFSLASVIPTPGVQNANGGTANVRNASDSSLTATKGSGEGLNQGLWVPSYTPAFRAAAVSNAVTKLMPFPNRLPFHPAYSGANLPAQNRVCDPATATSFLIPESGGNTVAYVSTCPYAITQRVTVGMRPEGIAGTPDGQFAWVTNEGEGTVSVVNIASATVVATIQLPPFDGLSQPTNIVITPDGSTAYVIDFDADPGSLVYVIDVPSRTVIKQISVGALPASIALTPDGTQAWVTCGGTGGLYVIDTLTNTIVGNNPNLVFASGVAFTPNGAQAYGGEGIQTGGYVAVVDTTTFEIKSQIVVGAFPHVLAVTPSGHDLFVTNLYGGTISQIDTSTNTVTQTITVGNDPWGLLFLQ